MIDWLGIKHLSRHCQICQLASMKMAWNVLWHGSNLNSLPLNLFVFSFHVSTIPFKAGLAKARACLQCLEHSTVTGFVFDMALLTMHLWQQDAKRMTEM